MADPTIKMYKDTRIKQVKNTPDALAAWTKQGWSTKQPPAVAEAIEENQFEIYKRQHPMTHMGYTEPAEEETPEEILQDYKKAGITAANTATGTDIEKNPEKAVALATAMLATAPLGPEAGVGVRALASTLGGAAGDIGTSLATGKFNQYDKKGDATHDLRSSLLTGAETGAVPEFLAAPLGWLAERIGIGRMGVLPGKRIPGEHLTPGNTAEAVSDWSRYYKNLKGPGGRAVEDEVAKEATHDIYDIIDANDPLSLQGQKVKDTITRIGAPAYKAIVHDMVDEMRVQTGGYMVDTEPMKVVASQLLTDATKVARMGVGGRPLKSTALDPSIRALYGDVLKLPDKMPFMNAFELRKRWRQVGKDQNALLGKAIPSQYSKFVGELTKAMDTAVARDPGANAAWQDFRSVTKEGAEEFQDRVIRKLLDSHPEKIAEQLGANSETMAKEIYDATVGWPERNAIRNPSPQASQAVIEGHKALDRFRTMLIQTKLMEGGIFNLGKNLSAIGDPALTRLFGGDAHGVMTLKNIRDIAGGIDRLKRLQSPRMSALNWLLRGIPDAIMGNILRDPKASALYLHGIAGWYRELNGPGAKIVTKASYAVTPRLAKYLADIGRAWYIVDMSEPSPSSHKTNNMLQQSPLYQKVLGANNAQTKQQQARQ